MPDTGRVDTQRITPEHPHWPLVFMLVLTQLAAGAFASLWLVDAFGRGMGLYVSAATAITLAGLSLGASTLHLGRPVYAWRALRGLRRSWLSREVLSLSIFAGVATVCAGMLFLDVAWRPVVGAFTALCGAAGMLCSARIYVVRARPAWYSGYTVAEFFSTGLLLGPLFVMAMNVRAPWLPWAAAAGGTAQLITQTLKFLWLTRSEQFELRASSLLLSGQLRPAFLSRLGLLIAAGILLPLLARGEGNLRLEMAVPALVVALAGEWLGRWLFFVSVAPKNVAAAFTTAGRAA